MISIKWKYASITAIILLIVCIGLSVMSYFVAKNNLINNVNNQLEEMAIQGSRLVTQYLDGQWVSLEIIAANETIGNPSISPEKKYLYLKEGFQDKGVLNLVYADSEGNALAPNGVTKINIKDEDYFKSAINGVRVISDPIEDSAIAGRMINIIAVPVSWNGQVTGVLYKIIESQEISDITNQINFGKTGYAFMINSEGVAVANEDFKQVKQYSCIFELVKEYPIYIELAQFQREMLKGKTGYGEYIYKGVRKYAGYSPVKEAKWYLAVAAVQEDVLSELTDLKHSLIVYTLIIIIAGLIIILFYTSIFIEPIMTISEKLDQIALGDFTCIIPKKLMMKNDEIGKLANSLSSMQKSVSDVMKMVDEETVNVVKNVNMQEENIEFLINEIEDVSATVEQLTAGAQETAASTEEMSIAAIEIESIIKSITTRARETTQNAYEISKKTLMLNEIFRKSSDLAKSMYSNTGKAMEIAVEDAMKVKEINILSEAILQISSKTNLLARNVVIESERAGNLGSEFAVVAEEIGKLTEESKSFIEKIQTVTAGVVDSVNSFSNNSSELLEFVHTRVTEDYEILLSISEQYNQDAILVNELVAILNNTSEELLETMMGIVKTINEISIATQEGAEGNASIAYKMEGVMNSVEKVYNYAKETRDRSNKLVEAITKFIINN